MLSICMGPNGQTNTISDSAARCIRCGAIVTLSKLVDTRVELDEGGKRPGGSRKVEDGCAWENGL